MNRQGDSIALAEKRVAEARTAALAEYEAARAMQVLLPLWIALGSATRAARRPGADIGRTAR